jgi:Na+-driven multidrug efflux pump
MLTITGNLNRQIIKLAWPVFFQNLARSVAIAILDSYWIGKLGSEHLAAIAVGTFLSWGSFALGELIPIGTNSLVAQATGAKEPDSAKHIGTLNLINSVLWGIIVGVVMYLLLPLLYNFTNLDASKSLLAGQYLFPILVFLPVVILFETGSAIFRGSGNTQTPFRLLIFVFS